MSVGGSEEKLVRKSNRAYHELLNEVKVDTFEIEDEFARIGANLHLTMRDDDDQRTPFFHPPKINAP